MAFAITAFGQQYSQSEKDLIRDYEEGLLNITTEAEKQVISNYLLSKYAEEQNVGVSNPGLLNVTNLFFTEDFEDPATYDDWAIEDLEGGFPWDFGQLYEAGGTLEGNYIFADSDGAGNGAGRIFTTITSPSISLEGYTGEGLYLTFDHHYLQLSNQVGRVQVSTDSTSWTTVKEYNTSQGSVDFGAGLATGVGDIVDLASFESADEIYVRFEFDDDGGWTWHWLVDNVSVFESEPPPTIAFSPAEVDFGTLFTGSTGSVTLNFENSGFARLEIFDIDTPDGIDVSTTSLSLIPGNTASVTFTYEAITSETIADSIFLTTNVPNNETIGIPVSAESVEALTELFEDFDDFSGGDFPGLWTGTTFSVTEGFGVEGSNMFRANQWFLVTEANFQTPFIDLSDAESPLLSFEYRVTNWVSSGPPTTPTPPGAFEISLIIVSDDGSTEVINTIGEGNHEPSLDYATVVFDLSEYAGQTIAFQLDSEYIGGDFNLDVDNVLVGDPPADATPLVSIDREEIQFGDVIIGGPATETVTLTNDGIVPVTISTPFISGPFSTNLQSETTLSVGQSLGIEVTFDPEAAGEFIEDLIIETSADDFIVLLEGMGLEAPEFTVGSNLLSNSVTVGVDGQMLPGENNVGLILNNSGAGTLQYSFPAYAAMAALQEAGSVRNNSEFIEFSSTPQPGELDTRVGHPVVLGAGGPDEFGYYWVDSGEGFGPQFSWIDAAQNGVLIESISGTDDSNTTVALPFDFSFYGETYSELTVSVNGWLSFEEFQGWGNVNSQIPSMNAPNALIAAFWDDLSAENGGQVYTYESDGTFVVEWNELSLASDSETTYTFQAILHDDGTVMFQYHTLNGPVNSGTVGVENGSGDTGLQIAFNTDYVTENLAITVSNAPQFITNVVPSNGTVDAQSEREVFVQIDMSGFTPGIYTEDIVVLTNDPVNSREVVTVEIEVAGTPSLVVLENLEFSIEELPFGDVFVGALGFEEVQIANLGSDSLTLTSLDLTGDAFEYTIAGFDPIDIELPLTLEPEAFIPIEFTFSPTEQVSYTGEFTVESEDGQEWVLSLSGTGTQPPSASIDTEGFEFNVAQGETVDTSFTIENLEKALLEFNITFGTPGDEVEESLLPEPENGNLSDFSPLNISAARMMMARSANQVQNAPERLDNHLDILWDNPVAGTGGIISTDFSPIDTPIYTAGNFELFNDADVSLIFAPGFNSGGGALTPAGNPSLNFYIYEDDGGVPAGNPADGTDNHVWFYSTTVDGDGVTITEGSQITLNIEEATGEPLEISMGSYWLIVVPEANTANLGGAERWNWLQGSPVAAESQILDPTDAFGAGFTDWTGLGTAIGDWTHVAFRLEGSINFPLLVSPLSGTVEGGPENAQTISVTFSPEEAGSFEYSINIATNDPQNPVISIPVTANVEAVAEGPARLQVVHNAADPAGEFVDVYVNGDLLLEEFEFRTATPFMDVPSDTELELDVAVSGTGIEESFYNTTVTLAPSAAYTVVANGVVGGGFLANPDGEDIGFNLYVLANARESAENINEVDIRLFHGVTDAPTLDLEVTLPNGDLVEIEGFGYGDQTDYLSLAPAMYDVDVLASASSSLLFSHTLDLSEDNAFAATVIASGFVNGNANNRGELYELMAVYENGSVVLVEGIATSVDGTGLTPREFSLNQNYPNPFNPSTEITYSLPQAEMVTLEIFDMIGRKVATLVSTEMSAGVHQATFDASNLSSGVYLYRLQAGSYVSTQKMMLVK